MSIIAAREGWVVLVIVCVVLCLPVRMSDGGLRIVCILCRRFNLQVQIQMQEWPRVRKNAAFSTHPFCRSACFVVSSLLVPRRAAVLV